MSATTWRRRVGSEDSAQPVRRREHADYSCDPRSCMVVVLHGVVQSKQGCVARRSRVERIKPSRLSERDQELVLGSPPSVK